MRRSTLVVSLALFMAVWSGAGAQTPKLAKVHVVIRGLAFVPKVVHVTAGTTVIWTNEDDVPHTVTSGTSTDDGTWTTSPAIAQGQMFNVRFTKPGTFPYYCKPHFYNENMHGTVIVTRN